MSKSYKHALLLFSKPPIPGLVKTRLSTLKGGPFSPEDAAAFFHRSMFDVMENCIQAVTKLEAEDAAAQAAAKDKGEPEPATHQYDFFISTTPAENVAVMRKTFEDSGSWPREFTYLEDEGANFDDHFDSAFKQIFDKGYDTVLSVGGDIPMMPQTHITQAYRWLQYFLENSEKGGLVEAPCQACGVSMIGWTRDTDMDHQGVYYNMNGRPALQAYVDKCRENGDVPMASLPPIADVDDMEDLAHAITLARSAEYGHQFQPDFYVPKRFLDWVDFRGIHVTTPPNEDRDSRDGIDK
jgi:glycosyltransferase A (GT-A) superfamily protein (DUF2064 family)